jgi:hypothetical protein
MECLFLLCAESASVDTGTNRLSIFNVIEEISAAGFPAIVQNLTTVAMFSKKKSESGKVTVTVRIETDKSQQANLPIELDFQGKDRIRLIAGLQNVQISGKQAVRVSIIHKKTLLAFWPIAVNVVGHPQLAPQPAPVKSETSVVKSRAKKRVVRRKK